jgi:hypothetical protein
MFWHIGARRGLWRGFLGGFEWVLVGLRVGFEWVLKTLAWFTCGF